MVQGLIRFESSLEFDGCSVIADEGTMLVSGGAIWNGEDGTIVIKGDVNAGFNVAVDSVSKSWHVAAPSLPYASVG